MTRARLQPSVLAPGPCRTTGGRAGLARCRSRCGWVPRGAQPTTARPPPRAAISEGEVDDGAVLPEAFKLVIGPLLLVLDVHDDVREVDQDPSAVALALAAYRLDAELAKLVLDTVDDRTDLAVVGSRRQNEDISERELFTDVDGDDLAGQLVLGSCGDSLGEINGTLRGGHAVLLVIVLFNVIPLLAGLRCSMRHESVGASRL